jgi:hypothetical protein
MLRNYYSLLEDEDGFLSGRLKEDIFLKDFEDLLLEFLGLSPTWIEIGVLKYLVLISFDFFEGMMKILTFFLLGGYGKLIGFLRFLISLLVKILFWMLYFFLND